jgi:hypothetical protein
MLTRGRKRRKKEREGEKEREREIKREIPMKGLHIYVYNTFYIIAKS